MAITFYPFYPYGAGKLRKNITATRLVVALEKNTE
jgi:hypothetical protein